MTISSLSPAMREVRKFGGEGSKKKVVDEQIDTIELYSGDVEMKSLDRLKYLENTINNVEREDEEPTVVTIEPVAKKRVPLPAKLRIILREDEEVAFYIPPKSIYKSKLLIVCLILAATLSFFGAVGMTLIDFSYIGAIITAAIIITMYIAIRKLLCPPFHYVITNFRFIQALPKMLLRAESCTSYEFEDLLKPLIVDSNADRAVTVVYNRFNRGDVSFTHGNKTVVFHTKNIPDIIEFLAYNFSRVIVSKGWNIPDTYSPQRRITFARGRSLGETIALTFFLSLFYVAYFATVALFFMNSSLADVTPMFLMFLLPFGIFWMGAITLAMYGSIRSYIDDSNKRSERYIGVGDHRDAVRPIRDVNPDRVNANNADPNVDTGALRINLDLNNNNNNNNNNSSSSKLTIPPAVAPVAVVANKAGDVITDEIIVIQALPATLGDEFTSVSLDDAGSASN